MLATDTKGETSVSTIRRETSTPGVGPTRRDFLRVGSVGLGSLGLRLTDLGVLARDERQAGRSVILLLLVGGPSQLETWDPKPDAPAEVRGPFQSIATCCPGVRASASICLEWPREWIDLRSFARFITTRHRFTRRGTNCFRPGGFAGRESITRTSARWLRG